MRFCQFIAIFFINTLFFGQINIFSDYNKELAENMLKENAEITDSLQLFKKQNPHKLIDNSEMFKRLGFYLGTLGQPDLAIKYLEIALSLTPNNTLQF